jgi:hypothetical protein
MAWGKFTWATHAFISGPLYLVALLFALNWLWRADLRARS